MNAFSFLSKPFDFSIWLNSLAAKHKSRNAKLLVGFGAIAISLSAASYADPLPGTLDLNFGSAGIVTTNVQSSAVQSSNNLMYAGRVLSSGKLMALGSVYGDTQPSIAVVRYNKNGSLDQSFGTGGISEIKIGEDTKIPVSFVETANGNLVVLCQSSSTPGPCLLRLNANGSLDNSFGSAGVSIFPPPSGSLERSLGLVKQRDGKLLSVGGSYDFSGNNSLFVRRFNPNGSPDLSFGVAGITTTNVSGVLDGTDVSVQEDGRIVVVGSKQTLDDTPFSGVTAEIVVVRFHANGRLDMSFGLNGSRVIPVLSSNSAAFNSKIRIYENGKIIVGGSTSKYFADGGAALSVGLARLRPDGQMDNSFGVNGIVVNAFSSSNAFFGGIEIDEDQKLVSTATVFLPNLGYDLAIGRFSLSGAFDRSFNSGNVKFAGVASGFTEARDIRIQEDEKIVVFGRTFNGLDDDLTLVRLRGGSRDD
jgi:uncharacterized delta-60 repeat protein